MTSESIVDETTSKIMDTCLPELPIDGTTGRTVRELVKSAVMQTELAVRDRIARERAPLAGSARRSM